MVRVKICGLMEPEHALAAAAVAADFVGMVLAPGKRYIPPEKAAGMVAAVHDLGGKTRTVGVFVNLPAPELNAIARRCNFDYVQLSGDEDYEYCREIEKPVIKVIHVRAGTSARDIIAEIEAGCRLLDSRRLIFLLDGAGINEYGGTGQGFDRQIAREVAARFPVIIAGGLTPYNVGQLVGEVSPWGVDVSSGVETAGRKDAAKIAAFIRAAREGYRGAKDASG